MGSLPEELKQLMPKDIIETHNSGHELMLVDMQYFDPRKKGSPDILYIIWRDLTTKEKHLSRVENPLVPIYFEKQELRGLHATCKTYAPIEDLTMSLVRAKYVKFAIADEIGPEGKAFLSSCFNTGDWKKTNEIFLYPYSFGADYDILTIYRYIWSEMFNTDADKIITKGFLDIEVDLTNAIGFPSALEDPIDLVTIIDDTTSTSYTFCLIGIKTRSTDPEEVAINKERIKLQEYYAEHPDKLIDKAHEMFDENYPGMEYKFFFYKDELTMIIHIFQLLHQLKLDFLEIWNMRFDVPYFIDRLKAHNVDPAQIIPHPDFVGAAECWFQTDKRHFAIKEQADAFRVNDYTVWLCQMRNYASIRKGQSELRRNTLSYVSKRELRDDKLDYSEVGNLKQFAMQHWLEYVLYNIKDVLLQRGVETVTSDIDTIYVRSYENLTPYRNIFKQTVVLRSVQYRAFIEQGLIPGNNINAIINVGKSPERIEYEDTDDDDDDEEGYEGALVGDPRLNKKFGMTLYGKKTNRLYRYSIDFDMSAFYPSCIRANNIDPSTLIFKMIIDASKFTIRGGEYPYHGITDVSLLKDRPSTFDEDVSKEIIDNFQTKLFLSFGYKWLNLPSINQVVKRIKKEMK